MVAWVDCSSTSGYLGGYSADMGPYVGPWPPMFPPRGAADSRFNEVDFIVMLPNPADLSDVGIAGDGSYDTTVYATYTEPADANVDHPEWQDCGWWDDWVGPTQAEVMPPVLIPGMRLYVSIYPSSAPAETPESLVPSTYTATGEATNQWHPGGWTALQPASTRSGTSASGTAMTQPIVTAKENILHGYTNNADWAASTGLTLASLPFPSIDLTTLAAALESDMAALYPSSPAAGVGGMVHSWSKKHGYDPGDGLGIKAVDGSSESGTSQGPYAMMQLGQMHQATEVRPNQLPTFFDHGFGSIWADPVFDDSGDDWQPSGATTVEFSDVTGWGIVTAAVATYDGPLPSNPPDQTINIYARRTTHPLSSDPAAGFPGNIQDTTTMVFLGSFTAAIDFVTGGYTAPSTVDLPLSSVPIADDGSGYYGIEVVGEPAAWHDGVDIIDVADIDAAAIPNNSHVDHDSHYGFDFYLNSQLFPWVAHYPPFRYYEPGYLVPICEGGDSPAITRLPGHWSAWQPGFAMSGTGAITGGTRWYGSNDQFPHDPALNCNAQGNAAIAALRASASFSVFATDLQRLYTFAQRLSPLILFGIVLDPGGAEGDVLAGQVVYQVQPASAGLPNALFLGGIDLDVPYEYESPAIIVDSWSGDIEGIIGTDYHNRAGSAASVDLTTTWLFQELSAVPAEGAGVETGGTTLVSVDIGGPGTPTDTDPDPDAFSCPVPSSGILLITPKFLVDGDGDSLFPDIPLDGVYGIESGWNFEVTPSYTGHTPRWRYWVPTSHVAKCPPVLLDIPSLRMNQRNDGRGPVGAHARLQVGSGVPNGATSTQRAQTPRVGDPNRYS